MQYLGSTVKQGMSISKARNTNRVQIGKGVRQGCILSLCLYNVYAEYIMRNAELDEAQAGIKISGRNINKKYQSISISDTLTIHSNGRK